jgi:hypothetical protein
LDVANANAPGFDRFSKDIFNLLGKFLVKVPYSSVLLDRFAPMGVEVKAGVCLVRISH